MVILAPKLDGCDPCGVSHFLSSADRDFHMEKDAAHRLRLLCRMRKTTVSTQQEISVNHESIVLVLRKFKHLPLFGHHVCEDCGLVVEVAAMIDIESLVKALNAHLVSKYHKHVKFHTKLDFWKSEDQGCLPSETVALDHEKYVCYRCIECPEFLSFLSLCLHVNTVHPPLIPLKRKIDGFSESMPEYLKPNNDEWNSRTCTLCDVVVWSDSDPHLTGKRHLKALRNHPDYGIDLRFTSEC